MRSYVKTNLWAKIVNHFDVFDNLKENQNGSVTAAYVFLTIVFNFFVLDIDFS